MYLTLQTLLFESLNVIPSQFLGFPIIHNVPVVRADLLCIWEDTYRGLLSVKMKSVTGSQQSFTSP